MAMQRVIGFRLGVKEYKQVQRAAKKSNLRVGEYIRKVVLHAATHGMRLDPERLESASG